MLVFGERVQVSNVFWIVPDPQLASGTWRFAFLIGFVDESKSTPDSSPRANRSEGTLHRTWEIGIGTRESPQPCRQLSLCAADSCSRIHLPERRRRQSGAPRLKRQPEKAELGNDTTSSVQIREKGKAERWSTLSVLSRIVFGRTEQARSLRIRSGLY